MIILTGSDFVEMFVGVGPSRVRDLFQQAACGMHQRLGGEPAAPDEVCPSADQPDAARWACLSTKSGMRPRREVRYCYVLTARWVSLGGVVQHACFARATRMQRVCSCTHG